MSAHQPSTTMLAWSGLLVLLLAVTGCGSEDTTESTTESSADASAASSETLATPTLPEGVDPDIGRFEDFAGATFSNPTAIDNEYLPLTPGNQIVLSGTTIEDGEELDHQIRYVVTDLTKEILGVQTVVVWIEDYSDDELVEVEVAFYAQDDAGRVWFFGEHPEEYEDEELIDAPTWIAGIDGGFPGIAMLADPEPEGSPYFQGWGPAVEWSDFATVESVGEEICIEAGCYPGSIIIAESSLDEEGISQLKSYAPGVGNIQVDYRGEDATQEQLELVDNGPVSDTDLAEFNALAKALEANAYAISPDVYGLTTPME